MVWIDLRRGDLRRVFRNIYLRDLICGEPRGPEDDRQRRRLPAFSGCNHQPALAGNFRDPAQRDGAARFQASVDESCTPASGTPHLRAGSQLDADTAVLAVASYLAAGVGATRCSGASANGHLLAGMDAAASQHISHQSLRTVRTQASLDLFPL